MIKLIVRAIMRQKLMKATVKYNNGEITKEEFEKVEMAYHKWF